MTTKKVSLTPCPFCKNSIAPRAGTNIDLGCNEGTEFFGYTIYCDASPSSGGCGANCGFHGDEAEAIAAWNRRAPAPTEPAVDRDAVPVLYALVDPLGLFVVSSDGSLFVNTEKNCGYQSDYERGCYDMPLFATPASPAVPEPAPLAPSSDAAAWRRPGFEPEFTADSLLAAYWQRKGSPVTPLYEHPAPQVAQASQPTSAEELQQKEHIPPFAEPASQHESIAGAVARGWCAPENASKVMDEALAFAIIREVEAVLNSRCRAQGGITNDSKGLPTSAEAEQVQTYSLSDKLMEQDIDDAFSGVFSSMPRDARIKLGRRMEAIMRSQIIRQQAGKQPELYLWVDQCDSTKVEVVADEMIEGKRVVRVAIASAEGKDSERLDWLDDRLVEQKRLGWAWFNFTFAVNGSSARDQLDAEAKQHASTGKDTDKEATK